MSFVVAAVGLLGAALGLLGVVRPRTLVELVVRVWYTQHAYLVVAVARIAFGLALILALILESGALRFPGALFVIGIISLVSGITIPILGRARARAFVDYWRQRSDLFVRVWATSAVAFGAFLIFAAV